MKLLTDPGFSVWGMFTSKTENVEMKHITIYVWMLMLLMEENETCWNKVIEFKIIILVFKKG